MEDTDVTKTDKIIKDESWSQFWVWIIGFCMGALIVSLFFLLNVSHQNIIITYYKEQSKQLCQLSNEYRAMLLLKNPDFSGIIPDAVDCDKILNIPK